MSVKERSFWTTIPGLITGLAGVLTAIVGLITVSMQLGWLGSNNSNKSTAGSSPASTNVGGSPATTSLTSPILGGGTGSGSGSSATTSSSHLSVTPQQLTFQALGNGPQTVTVQNGGATAVGLTSPTINGLNPDQFTISKTDCTSSLGAGRSCDVQVTFLATKSGQSTAKLVIQPTSTALPASEVQLQGSALL